MTTEHTQHDYGMAKGYAPVAAGVILVDYDGTIFPWGPLYQSVPPMPGAYEAMNDLYAAGYTLRIFSSRCSPKWLNDAGQSLAKNIKHMLTELEKYGIPHHGVAQTKEPAIHYIDDRAIEYKNNWEAISDRLLLRAPAHEHAFNMTLDAENDICACGTLAP